MKKDIVEKIKRQFADRRRQAEDKAQANYERAMLDKTFAALDAEERSLCFEIGRDSHFGKDVTERQARLDEIGRQKAACLKKMGLSARSLEPQYKCSKCRDTGFVGGKRCACFQNAVAAELTKSSNIADPTLSLNSFVPKTEAQAKVAKRLVDFRDKYDASAERNLLVSGPTGTGKTYLVSCLAGDMLRKEMGVLFLSAFGLNKILLEAHLAPVWEKESLLADLLETDVLVIDDLGSESVLRNVTAEYLCLLVEERTAAGRGTFITTNLDPGKIQDRYGDRVFSRVFCDKTLKLRLDGIDLRLTKSEK